MLGTPPHLREFVTQFVHFFEYCTMHNPGIFLLATGLNLMELTLKQIANPEDLRHEDPVEQVQDKHVTTYLLCK
jgi:hypothetical protein